MTWNLDANARVIRDGHIAWCLNSVLNVKALVGAFNQEKALVGAFSVIVQAVVEPMDRFTALMELSPRYRVSPAAPHPHPR